MSTAPDSRTTFHTEIRYDRTTRDYALYLNGELVGYACSHDQGERTLDVLIYEQLTHESACSSIGGDSVAAPKAGAVRMPARKGEEQA